MELQLSEQRHPWSSAETALSRLVGLDRHRERLESELLLLLDPDRVRDWADRHHAGKLPLADRLRRRPPLVMLSGEVGCGKTELARAIGTPIARALKGTLTVFETPSNLRGSGLVGEISARITAAFSAARSRMGKWPGLLILDEADDVATSRTQLQAHHEDRAGLNVLVRQIDLLARDEVRLAVILITNRAEVLDPAIRRRAALHLHFPRPDATARRALFSSLLRGIDHSSEGLDRLAEASERSVPYSYADLVERVAEQALRDAVLNDQPLSLDAVLLALGEVEPTPLIENHAQS